MTRESARLEIRSRWRELLLDYTSKARRKVNGEDSYICPICGNGSKDRGDGLTFNPKIADKNTLHCFHCGFNGDIIALVQDIESKNYNETLSLLAERCGITIDPYFSAAGEGATQYKRAVRAERAEQAKGGAGVRVIENEPQKAADNAREAAEDYTAYYQECVKRLSEPKAAEYLKSRGISEATAAAYMIGFDPAADPAGKGHPSPRFIIPTSKTQYIGRSIDAANPYRYINSKGESPDFFNAKTLYAQDVREIFITEGAFDALSIIEAGGNALALNSTSNAGKLLRQLEKRRTEATVILCLDNDKPGREATKTLSEGLSRLNIPYIEADICNGYKDPNEALQHNPEEFKAAVANAREQEAEKPDNTARYIDILMPAEIDRYKAGSSRLTGFASLDAQMGGLYSGLYILAAIPSLGKTSFALQMADQIAKGGVDVLFFSLEQSRLELVSKSLARGIGQEGITSLTIRNGKNAEEVAKAAADYKRNIGDRLSIIEGNFACNTEYISKYASGYIKRTGNRPVIIIDYLQILQPTDANGRKSAKEAMDSTITEIKRISRGLDVPIWAISSVNRDNYLKPTDYQSLKESGGIEYTADAVFGMQFQCIHESGIGRDDIVKAKAENPRKIELVCLKNRYGISGFKCNFDYYPARDTFIESEESEEQKRTARRI